jgi:hypothetical protein
MISLITLLKYVETHFNEWELQTQQQQQQQQQEQKELRKM